MHEYNEMGTAVMESKFILNLTIKTKAQKL